MSCIGPARQRHPEQRTEPLHHRNRQIRASHRPIQLLQRAALFDHVVSSGEQHWGNIDPQSLRRLEIDDQLELRRLLDR